MRAVKNTLEHQKTSIQALHVEVDSVGENIKFQNNAQIRNHRILRDLSQALPAGERRLNSKLDIIAGILSQVEASHNTFTSNTSFQCLQESLGGIVRYELSKLLTPVTEENFTKSESRNEALLREIKSIVESSASDLSRHFMSIDNQSQIRLTSSSQLPYPVEEDQQPDPSSFNEALPPRPGADTVEVLTKLATNQEHYSQESSSPNTRSERIWSNWSSSWIGRVRIEVRRIAQVEKASGSQKRSFDLSISFWPSRYSPRRRCVSLFYTNKANEYGYYQICPMIATFPIIAEDSPVWDCVRYGDLNGLHSLFLSGLASPNDQDDEGITLLHVRSLSSKSTCYGAAKNVPNSSAVYSLPPRIAKRLLADSCCSVEQIRQGLQRRSTINITSGDS